MESQKEYERENIVENVEKNIASIEEKIKNLQEELIKEKNKLK